MGASKRSRMQYIVIILIALLFGSCIFWYFEIQTFLGTQSLESSTYIMPQLIPLSNQTENITSLIQQIKSLQTNNTILKHLNTQITNEKMKLKQAISNSDQNTNNVTDFLWTEIDKLNQQIWDLKDSSKQHNIKNYELQQQIKSLKVNKSNIHNINHNINHYKFNDPIPIRVSNVAPFHNPTEKLPYDFLPWTCKPKELHSDNPNLGSTYSDKQNRESLYQIHFQRSTNKQIVCFPSFWGEKELSGHAVNKFISAINDEYQYEMWVDDLPVFGRVGFAQPNEMMGDKLYFLITHRHFDIKYNGDQVITANISTRLQPDHYVEIKKDTPLEQVHFTYSLQWSPTTIQYSERWEEQMRSIFPYFVVSAAN